MADKSEVEVLINLPFFQNLFEQMMLPMLQSLKSFTAEDAALVTDSDDSVREAYRFIFDGMMEVTADFYCEFLSNDEVRELVIMYQNPVFLKLQKSMEQVMPKMFAWFELHEEQIDELFEKIEALA